jgi:CubicO group peptidase (beta-lactamase class C family)
VAVGPDEPGSERCPLWCWHDDPMSVTPVSGHVGSGFGEVREVFTEVLARQPGTGAAFAVWRSDEWVVDLWGGWADAEHTRPWTRDTLVMPYSVTKPFAALCVLVLADRRVVDLDAPIQTWWPELRARTTLRQVLSHRAGLVVLTEPAPEDVFYDWDAMCALLERQEPLWEPGTAQGESALFYGHLLGEVVRRVDGRTLGRFLREEICEPHGLDFHVGLGPAELDRVADLTGFGEELSRSSQGAPELYAAAIGNPPGARDPAVLNSRRWRTAEIPAINGHGTARAVAGMYVALQQGALLSPPMMAALTTGLPEEPELVVGGGTRSWGLGVGLDPDGYGMGGVGGSFGWWSEGGQYACGFVTGHIGGHDRGDLLENAVRRALGLPPV